MKSLDSKRKAIIFLIIVFFASCNSSEDMFFEFKEFELKMLEEYQLFRIDKETGFENQIWDFNYHKNYYSFFNSLNRKIYIYEMGDTNYLKSIEIPLDGPNGIPYLKQLHLHSIDSIFVLSAVPGQVQIHLINDEGVKVNSFQLTDSRNGDPVLSVYQINDLTFHNPYLFLITLPSVNTIPESKKSLLVYNIETNERELLIDMPKSYFTGDLSFSQNTGATYGALNPKDDEFLVGYGYDSELVLVNLEDRSLRKVDGSSKLVNLPEPTFNPKNSSFLEGRHYIFGNSWFHQIQFDPKFNLYLRSASIGMDFDPKDPNPDMNLVNSINGDKTFFLMFLFDENLKPVGRVPDFSFLRTILFTKDGTYKQVGSYKGEETIDPEDYIIFQKFQYLPDSIMQAKEN
jgi:hypothetical protein